MVVVGDRRSVLPAFATPIAEMEQRFRMAGIDGENALPGSLRFGGLATGKGALRPAQQSAYVLGGRRAHVRYSVQMRCMASSKSRA